jgi:hypothetical protein
VNSVLICLGGRIEEAAVHHLLRRSEDAPLVVSVPDARTIKEEILKMQPCVVILDAEAAVAKSAQVLDMLELLPRLRILVVHLESNVVEVFDKHEITLRQVSELVDMIHQAWPAASPTPA